MAGAASALFLLDIKGRVLIWRDYRGDVSAVEAERFFTKFIEKEGDPQSQDPVVYDNGVTYMFIQHSNVYLLTATRQNCNAAGLLFFLHRVVDVFKHYFEELEEESLRDNFVVVYKLLEHQELFGPYLPECGRYDQGEDSRGNSQDIQLLAHQVFVFCPP